jgi:predicted branched-subunit amino acid permease
MVLALLSAVIAVAVAKDWRAKEFLILAAVLNLIYWVVGQGLGGMFAGGATDPNAGPLFMLLAYAMLPLAGRKDQGDSVIALEKPK